MIKKSIAEITFKDINELVYRQGLIESQTIEIKRGLSFDSKGRPESKEFAKDVTALANAEGGYIFLGIDEKTKEVCGVNINIGNQKIEDWISNVLNDIVDRSLKYEIAQIPISEHDETKVVLIYIEEGKDKPYYTIIDKKHIVYIRKGTSVFPAKSSDIAAMYASENKIGNQSDVIIKQTAKGKRIQQIGQNFGKIVNTEKVQNVTEVLYDKDTHISDSQAKLIKDKIDEIVSIHDKAGKFKTTESKSKFFAQNWQNLKNRFSITKYTLLPQDRFEECMDWLQAQIAFKHRPVLRKGNNDTWKNQMYKSIYAKARSDWNMPDKTQVYNFAFDKLGIKTPISSLKDLSDVNLNKLYKILFSK